MVLNSTDLKRIRYNRKDDSRQRAKKCFDVFVEWYDLMISDDSFVRVKHEDF